MKLYKANGDGRFIEEEIVSLPESDLVKVKITKIMPTHADLDIFLGRAKIDYPFAPCYIAVGIVSDDKSEFGLKRGTKVILNPYVVMHNDDEKDTPEIKIYGKDMDGFLADYVLLPAENIYPFPDDVKEEEAIFAEYIALSLSVINSFHLEKGDYIAIIGGSPLCNIIAQLALYFQAIPIVIDHSEERLTKAEQCGVYYTVNTSKELTRDRVLEITGGRMADHTVLESQPEVTPHFLFSLAKDGGDCIIVSAHNYPDSLEADINLINQKQLTVRGISLGFNEFNSAIYLIAQKILKLPPLIEETTKSDGLVTLFNQLESQGFNLANIIEM